MMILNRLANVDIQNLERNWCYEWSLAHLVGLMKFFDDRLTREMKFLKKKTESASLMKNK